MTRSRTLPELAFDSILMSAATLKGASAVQRIADTDALIRAMQQALDQGESGLAVAMLQVLEEHGRGRVEQTKSHVSLPEGEPSR